MFGTFCWGAAICMALTTGGQSSMRALGMVMLAFSVTAQVAALPLIAQGAALLVIRLTALAANLRFVVYSAVVANEFRGRPMAQRVLIGWMTTDTGLAAAGLRRCSRSWRSSGRWCQPAWPWGIAVPAAVLALLVSRLAKSALPGMAAGVAVLWLIDAMS